MWALGYDGSSPDLWNEIEKHFQVTNIGSNFTAATSFELSQNYPNPFNPVTRINYLIPNFSHVTIKVYNILGQEISTLVNEVKNAGHYSVNLTSNFCQRSIFLQNAGWQLCIDKEINPLK